MIRGSRDTQLRGAARLRRGSRDTHLRSAGLRTPVLSPGSGEVAALAPTGAAHLGALPPTVTPTHPLQELP
jgi:hypothetical protein